MAILIAVVKLVPSYAIHSLKDKDGNWTIGLKLIDAEHISCCCCCNCSCSRLSYPCPFRARFSLIILFPRPNPLYFVCQWLLLVSCSVSVFPFFTNMCLFFWWQMCMTCWLSCCEHARLLPRGLRASSVPESAFVVTGKFGKKQLQNSKVALKPPFSG